MNERMKVLEMLEQGKLKADEAVRLLEVLDGPPQTPPQNSPQSSNRREEEEIEEKKKKNKGERHG